MYYGTALLLVLALGVGGCSDMSDPPLNPRAEETHVLQWDVYEISFQSDLALETPFWDAAATAEFVAPDGTRVSVEGFYYGGKEWRIRFVPRQPGTWTWKAQWTAKDSNQQKSGSFLCQGTRGHGYIRPSDRNVYRLEYEDGTPFYPIGVQTCGYFQVGFDGPLRSQHGGEWNSIPAEQWCKEVEGAINLVRWQMGTGTRTGCALPLIPEEADHFDRYDTDLAANMDDLLVLQKSCGMSHILIAFQDMSLWGGAAHAFGPLRDLKEFKSLQADNLPLQEKYLRYLVARFGCYVDIWELFNEDSWAPNDYLAHLASVIREADPYDHPITTNYARPREPWCEIVTWHEYMGVPPNEVDAHITREIALWKSFGKPVLNTEFGNQGQLSNVDPVKWRIAAWTAFMNESSLLWWSMSGIQVPADRPNARGNANAYIGPKTREAFRSLNHLNKDCPIDAKPVAIGYHEGTDLRTYALSNGEFTLLYLHHYANHETTFQLPYELMVDIGPGQYEAQWYDPQTAQPLGKAAVLSTKQRFLKIAPPPMKIDEACVIRRVDGKNSQQISGQNRGKNVDDS